MLTGTDSNNNPASQGLSTQGDPGTSEPSAFLMVTVVLLLFAGLLILGCEGWLAYKVPVSAQDLHDSSWLFSFAPVDYMRNVIGLGLSATCLVMGAVIGITRNAAFPVLSGVFFAVVLHAAGSPTVQLRESVAGGTAKIGCFVWDSKECRQMLGVPVSNARSMYVPRAEADRTGEVYEDWYLKARRKLEPSLLQTTIPLLKAPYYALNTDELNARLNAQRAEVARFRAANGASAPTAH